jgi:hypothetical protein
VFDGVRRRWEERFPVTNPAVYGGRIGYDDQTSQVVMIGSGEDAGDCVDVLAAQTWTWDGTNWTQQHPTTSPGECEALAASGPMVYDRATQKLMLNTAEGFEIESWDWDGSNWKRVGSGPENAGVAYDPAFSRTVAFGGYDDYLAPQVFGTTMTWNGTEWAQLLHGGGAHQPLRRGFASMTFDGALHALIMFGGRTINAADFEQTLHDTWSFVPNRWTRLQTSGLPPPTSGADLVYDSAHRFALLLGPGTWLLT